MSIIRTYFRASRAALIAAFSSSVFSVPSWVDIKRKVEATIDRCPANRDPKEIADRLRVKDMTSVKDSDATKIKIHEEKLFRMRYYSLYYSFDYS